MSDQHGRRLCSAKTVDGRPCGAKAKPGSDLCPWHQPEYRERHKALSAKGGANRSNRARAAKQIPAGMMTMEEIQAFLCISLKGVLAGRVEPGRANALANVARAIASIAGAANFEAQLAEMRQQIAELSRELSA